MTHGLAFSRVFPRPKYRTRLCPKTCEFPLANVKLGRPGPDSLERLRRGLVEGSQLHSGARSDAAVSVSLEGHARLTHNRTHMCAEVWDRVCGGGHRA